MALSLFDDGRVLFASELNALVSDINALASGTALGSTANYLTWAGGTTGNPATISALGSDSNVPLRLIPKGTSHVEVRVGLTVGVASSSGGAVFYGPLNGSGRALLVSQSMILSGSTSGSLVRYETALSGTTTANPAIQLLSLNDNLQAAAGVNWRMASITYGGNQFQGGRNGDWVNINSNADCTNNGQDFLVAGAHWWRARHYHNGYPGAERGAVFGINPLGWLGNSGTIGSRRMRGVQGAEVNFGASFNTLYRTGVRVVEWGDNVAGGSTGIGMWQDASMSFGRLTDADLPGVLTLWAIGDSLGDWPLAAAGTTFMETQPTQIASPSAYTSTMGWNIPDITFDYSSMWLPGFFIGASGNVGGRNISGLTLQTQSVITAKTAVLSGVTVARGGRFRVWPTLTCSASPGGGTLAVVAVTEAKADWPYAMTGIYGARGTGYVVGDVLTDDAATGTAATRAQWTVRAVDSTGQIIDMEPTTPGSYSVQPTNPITLTGGAGSGAAVTPYWNVVAVGVTTPGTLYTEYNPPNITASGGASAKFVNPILIPQMTATQVQLQLNNGKINVTGIPTSSVGLSAGDVYSNAGVLTVV